LVRLRRSALKRSLNDVAALVVCSCSGVGSGRWLIAELAPLSVAALVG
jgi:hypothetical protein